jgi:hypothetical protein
VGFIKSYLRDLVRSSAQPAAVVGRATVPPPREDDQPTLGLPRAAVQLNDPRGYVGLRLDIKARNRNAGPCHRAPGVAL